jgi:hypothetical protein
VTAQQLINRSLTLANRLGAGRTPGAVESGVALDVLNAMVEQWNILGLVVYAIGDATYTLTASQQSYEIGPSAADFDTTWPAFIESANILLDVSGETVKKPLLLINAKGWGQIDTPADESLLPKRLYCDYAIPVARLRFYPIPSTEVDLELFTWQQLSAIASLVEEVDLPTAYERALVYNLAVELAAMWQTAPLANVPEVAVSSKAEISALNAARRGAADLMPQGAQ